MSNENPTGTRIVAIGPLVLVAIWLVVSGSTHAEWPMAVIALFGLLYWPVFLIGTLVFRFRLQQKHTPNASLKGSLVHCFLAPFSLVPLWGDTPGRLGGQGAMRLFLDSLWQEPNLGPFNAEMLVAIVCVLTAGVLPVFFALYSSRAQAKQSVQIGLLGLYVLVYVTYLVLFDAMLLFGGAITCCGLLWFSTGALIRIASFFAMLHVTWLSRRRTEP